MQIMIINFSLIYNKCKSKFFIKVFFCKHKTTYCAFLRLKKIITFLFVNFLQHTYSFYSKKQLLKNKLFNYLRFC